MKRFGGEGTFYWFYAEVVNINDPDMLGQCQIRIDGFHDEFSDEELPWAMPLLPITSASYQTPEFGEVGTSPTGILVGSFAYGFFADGSASKIPIIFGTQPAIKEGDIKNHDVPQLAREVNTFASRPRVEGEPESSYGAKYPYNKVTRTQSGHTIEIDDTPNAERIHVHHKSGTYIEISADGRMVTKVATDNYHIVMNDENVKIMGKATIIIEGDANITVLQNANIEVLEDADLHVGGTLNIGSAEDLNLSSGKSINITSGKDINFDYPGNFNNN
jgi:hypothetical protein